MENVRNIQLSKSGNPAWSTGFWSALSITVLGAAYFLLIIVTMVIGDFRLPPPAYVQTFAAVVDLLLCPALVILFVSILYTVAEEKKAFAHVGLIFATIFAVMVTTNRFIQITVVRLSTIEGDLDGLKRFLPYDTRSAMFALELFGFGFFLSIALLFAAMSLSPVGLQRKVRFAFFVYAVLGLVSIAGYTANSLITNVGFVAWGLVLYIGTGLLAAAFRKQRQEARS